MKKIGLIIAALFIFLVKGQSQIYMSDSCSVAFFSATSAENIDAENKISKLVMSSGTGDIQISISNQDFIFKSKLMQEHFNEDYMESDKYPHTVFKGKVNEKVDYAKDGTTSVTVTGSMNMHGVIKTITIPGYITVKGGNLHVNAKFDLKMADYNMKIPSVLGTNVAEQVAITLSAYMKPYKVK